MTKSLAFIAGIMFICSCTNNTGSTSNTDSLNTGAPRAAKPGKQSAKACYAWYKNKDSVTLTLITFDDKVTGNLVYNLYEKDKNKGTLQGVIHGDTLLADYTFSSEGMQSVRQVAFLKKDSALIQGFGEMVQSDSLEKFKENSTVKYDGSITLLPVDCQ